MSSGHFSAHCFLGNDMCRPQNQQKGMVQANKDVNSLRCFYHSYQSHLAVSDGDRHVSPWANTDWTQPFVPLFQ